MFENHPERNALIGDKLTAAFPGAVLETAMEADMFCISVTKGHLHDILRLLRDDTALGFHFLTTLCGMHYPGSDPRLGMVYHLHNLQLNHRIRLKCFSPESDPHFPTVTDLWDAADWMERETYDFFGIEFDGHPKLKRILNVDDFEGFPLRKDFRLEDQTREDKNDAMFGR